MQTAVKNQKEVVRRGFDALNDRDYERFRTFHTKDVVMHEQREDIRGIDAIIEHEASFIEAFPDLEYHIEAMVEEGDRVALRHVATGTHEGTFQGIEPTGTRVRIPVMMMFRLEHGRIAEVWLQPDRLGLLEQLGVMDGSER